MEDVRQWGLCLCRGYWDPSSCSLPPSLPRPHEVDYPHHEVQSYAALPQGLGPSTGRSESMSLKEPFFFLTRFIYFLLSFWLYVVDVCVMGTGCANECGSQRLSWPASTRV